jgi:hypothetical protein
MAGVGICLQVATAARLEHRRLKRGAASIGRPFHILREEPRKRCPQTAGESALGPLIGPRRLASGHSGLTHHTFCAFFVGCRLPLPDNIVEERSASQISFPVSGSTPRLETLQLLN